MALPLVGRARPRKFNKRRKTVATRHGCHKPLSFLVLRNADFISFIPRIETLVAAVVAVLGDAARPILSRPVLYSRPWLLGPPKNPARRHKCTRGNGRRQPCGSLWSEERLAFVCFVAWVRGVSTLLRCAWIFAGFFFFKK